MTLPRTAAVVLALTLGLAGCARPQTAEQVSASASPAAPAAPSMSADALVLLAEVVDAPPAPTTTVAPSTTTVDVRSAGRPGYLDATPRDPAPAVETVTVRPAPEPEPSPAALSSPPPTTVPAPPPTTEPPATTQPPPTTTAPPPPTTTVAAADPSAGAAFASLINSLRAEVGVAGLARNGQLDALAQSWTEYMAGSGDFRHSSIISDLVNGGWSIAGENIGYGPSVDAVFSGLRASQGHYDNMVEARFTSVGVGVVVDAAGVVWTTHLFAG